MSLAPLEHGASLRRQFKKAEVAAGSLKGARYLDVGWEDLKKAAKSYKSDPRFNQFAKRCVSERALASEGAHVDAQEGNSDGHAGVRLGSICKRVMSWTFCKAKGRIAVCSTCVPLPPHSVQTKVLYFGRKVTDLRCAASLKTLIWNDHPNS